MCSFPPLWDRRNPSYDRFLLPRRSPPLSSLRRALPQIAFDADRQAQQTQLQAKVERRRKLLEAKRRQVEEAARKRLDSEMAALEEAQRAKEAERLRTLEQAAPAPPPAPVLPDVAPATVTVPGEASSPTVAVGTPMDAAAAGVPAAGAVAVPEMAAAVAAPAVAIDPMTGQPVVMAAPGAGQSVVLSGLSINELSEIKQRLEHIDMILAKNRSIPDGDAFYLSEADQQWRGEGLQPTPVDPSALSVVDYVAFRFGADLVSRILVYSGRQVVNLSLARTLPETGYHHNAFRRSYWYHAATGTLWLRLERLQGVGDLVVVLAHALAHIMCGQMEDDTAGEFLRHFHLALRIIGEDLFYSKNRSQPARVLAPTLPEPGATAAAELQGVRAPGTLTQEEVEAALRAAPIDQPSALISSLIDARLAPDSDPTWFAPEALQARLASYEAFTRSATLKMYLTNLEAAVQARDPSRMESYDHIELRLRELDQQRRDIQKGAASPALEILATRLRDRLQLRNAPAPGEGTAEELQRVRARLADHEQLADGLNGLLEAYHRRNELALNQVSARPGNGRFREVLEYSTYQWLAYTHRANDQNAQCQILCPPPHHHHPTGNARAKPGEAS